MILVINRNHSPRVALPAELFVRGSQCCRFCALCVSSCTLIAAALCGRLWLSAGRVIREKKTLRKTHWNESSELKHSLARYRKKGMYFRSVYLLPICCILLHVCKVTRTALVGFFSTGWLNGFSPTTEPVPLVAVYCPWWILTAPSGSSVTLCLLFTVPLSGSKPVLDM